MKKVIICIFWFIFFFILCCKLQSQISYSSRYSIKLDTVSVDRYMVPETKEPDTKAMFLKVNYGDFSIVNLKEAEKLKNAVILQVDLVYTKYPVDDDFSELNFKRVEYLHMVCPSIFNNTMAQWRIVAQTGAKTEYAASTMFHGFYIKYKPAPTKESAEREFGYLADVLKGKKSLEDSSIFKIMERNKWKNITVVSDFTGSMSPYITQVMMWYNMTFAVKNIDEFVFFNDGDMKDDAVKKMGSTGGLYYVKAANKDSVLKVASLCSSSGFGGDVQENNVEAALFAVKKNPKLKEIVMLVDNWAPMRDYAMISMLKVPVRVIICGKGDRDAVNPEYLDLAYRTKGSVHTIEEDLHNISAVAEGKLLKIDGVEFRLMGGRFVKTKS
ncbi:MAG: hypothetical protein K0S32_3280 [Bacteroidetes bacterium]|jgi:hypothetical protein|nr:hypothetical protein [Bacteroidota bacterium]